MSLPFNRTLERLKGNRSQWSLKVGHIHVNPQIGSCQIMFVLCRIHFVSTLPYCLQLGISLVEVQVGLNK